MRWRELNDKDRQGKMLLRLLVQVFEAAHETVCGDESGSTDEPKVEVTCISALKKKLYTNTTATNYQ